jgi:hypothetical protein
MGVKSMKSIAKLAAGLLVAGFAAGVSAQTITFSTPSPANTTQGTAANGVFVDVIYTAPAMNGPAVVGVDVFIPAEFTGLTSNDNSECIVGQPAAGRIRISQVDINLAPIPSNTICRLTFNVGAAVTTGTYNFSLCNAASGGGCVDPVGATVNFGAGFQVTAAPVATGPQIVAGSPAFGSTTAVSGGTLGGPAVTQNISFGASTGGANGGTTALVCTDDDANTTLSAAANQTGITNGATPASITASFTPGAARTVVVSCTATRQGAGEQTFSYTFNVAAGAVATGPTLTPPAQTAITVNGNAVGAVGTNSIQYTAAGGTAGQSTALACTVTSGAPAVSIVSGGSQNVATGSQPAPVVVGVTLTNAAQPNVGTVTCNGTVFTISAPAGSTFVPPAVIPASSLWSQLSLIALFAALGGVVLVLRRNG